MQNMKTKKEVYFNKDGQIKVGDRIKFSTITRFGKSTQTRKVVEINDQLGIGVKFNGWTPFWLNNPLYDKIIEHYPA